MKKLETNKVYCEDSIKKLKEVEDNSIDFIFTDPPYFIANEVKLIRRSNKMKYKGKDLFLNEKWDRQWENREEYKKWLSSILEELFRVLKPDRHIVMWSDRMLVGWLMEQWGELGGKYRPPIFWKKTNPVPRARRVDMMHCIEMAFWGTKGNVKVENYNWQLGMRTDVFEFAIPQKQGNFERHPTQKAIQVALYLIAYLSKPHDIILDPFAGSGTFLVASVLLGRKYIGIEKEEKYIKMIEYRLKNLFKHYSYLEEVVNEILKNKNKNTSEEDTLKLLGNPERLIKMQGSLF